MTSDPMCCHGLTWQPGFCLGTNPGSPSPALSTQTSSVPGPGSGRTESPHCPLSPAPSCSPGQRIWLWDDFQAQSTGSHPAPQAVPDKGLSAQLWAHLPISLPGHTSFLPADVAQLFYSPAKLLNPVESTFRKGPVFAEG